MPFQFLFLNRLLILHIFKIEQWNYCESDDECKSNACFIDGDLCRGDIGDNCIFDYHCTSNNCSIDTCEAKKAKYLPAAVVRSAGDFEVDIADDDDSTVQQYA